MPANHRISRTLIEDLLRRITLAAETEASSILHAPFDGNPICDVPGGTRVDVEAALERARKAQARWAQTPVRVRADLMRRLHDLVFAHREELLDLVVLETGKARKHAFEEVADCALVARYYGYHGEKVLRPQKRRGVFPVLTSTHVLHQPIGVVGIITPWNYPLTLPLTDALPALLAGNAVVVKPATLTPLSALYVKKLYEEAGLPPDLFQVVTGSGKKAGQPLIELADYILFTGSTAVGGQVAKQAGERLIGCSMELGGKNPGLILPDADVKRTVDSALRACFASTGQLCVSVERLFVHQSLYEPFLAAFSKRVKALKLAPSFDYSVEIGSLISQEQLDVVIEHVDQALKKGATVVAGGKPRPDLGPYFFEPTILTGVTPEMKVFSQETFGPVVSVYPYRDLNEAIERANDTAYGLSAAVWTRNITEGRRVAAKLHAGSVSINEGYGAFWGSTDAPMGGFKQSGLGRRHGPEGLLKFTEPQTVSVQYLLGLGAPKGLSERAWANVLTLALKALKRIPGVR